MLLRRFKLPDHVKEIQPGLYAWKNPVNGFNVMIIHYSAHPDRDSSWVERVKKHYTTTAWEKEQEINFEVTAGGLQAFPKFKMDFIKQIAPNSNLPVIRSWDFGRVHPCVLWAQRWTNPLRLVILREYQGTNVELPELIATVKALSELYFKGFQFRDVCDPFSGSQRSDKAPLTAIEVLHQHNIFPVHPRYPKERGMTFLSFMVEKGMVWVNEKNCDIVREGFTGGYLIDEKTGQPKKDDFYIHSWDNLRYIVTAFFTLDEIVAESTKEKPQQLTIEEQIQRYIEEKVRSRLESESDVREDYT